MASSCQTLTRSQNGMHQRQNTPANVVSSTSSGMIQHKDATNHFQRLPLEILHAILELVIHCVGDERWVHAEPRYYSTMLVCRDWAEIASNIWWKTRRYTGPETEAPLASLMRLPLKRQQWYANKIQHLYLNETNASDFIVALKLDFPSLRTLEVTQRSDHRVGFACPVSQFIRRGLLELKLTHTYRTDDVLTALLQAPNLRTLKLCCESSDATSDKLLDVVERCSQLQDLELNFTIEALITRDVLAAIASLPYLTRLRLPYHEVTSEVSKYVLSTNTSPFRDITHLDLGAFHSTAIDLLGGLSTLTTLSLGIIGSAPVFQTLATLRSLQTLELRFHDAVAIGYSEWGCLTRLKHLHSIDIPSWDGFGYSKVDLSSITLDEFTSFFQALPHLICLEINATLSNTAELYIKAGEICKSIESLCLRGQFDSKLVLRSHTGSDPLYPMLELLRVHQFIEPQDEHTRVERVQDTALMLRKAAPKLLILHAGTRTNRHHGDAGLGPFVTGRDEFTACVEARHELMRVEERRRHLDEKYGNKRRSEIPSCTHV